MSSSSSSSSPSTLTNSLQVAWMKVVLDYPPGHDRYGTFVVLNRDDVVPDWFPPGRAQLLVMVGALRRTMVLDTDDASFSVIPSAIVAEKTKAKS